MNNLIKVSAFVLALTSAHVFAGSNEEKSKSSGMATTLPVSAPAIETQGPEVKNQTIKKPVQYTPEQKASIVELKLTGATREK